MFPQSYLEISRADLRYNAQAVINAVGCPVIGVVKCDGYGVSIAEAAAAWKSCGVTMFAVSDPEEALRLRACGYVQEDILLMAPVADAFILDKMLENNIILTVTGSVQASFYRQAGREAPVRVHVAVDTGMGRFGVRWNCFPELEEIYSQTHLRIEGIFSHFSASFEKRYARTRQQLEKFLSAVDYLKKAGCDVGMRHIANSCAALRFPETRLDAVRIGSALVGRLCAPVPVSLKPIGVVHAMVVDRRTLLKGDRTGYASVCKIKRNMDVAIVSLGSQCGFGLEKHADGFRHLEVLRAAVRMLRDYRQNAFVEWSGQRLSVIGRYGTQYTLVCAEGTKLQPGEYVTCRAIRLCFPVDNRKYV